MLLTDDPREANAAKSGAALDDSILRRLYSCMLKCRTVEERIRILFRQSRFSGNCFSAVGHEATEVGTTVDLLPEDTIAP
jgi:TPP-dependent pyruvate/acetoin dehydrogenase alpha subunit